VPQCSFKSSDAAEIGFRYSTAAMLRDKGKSAVSSEQQLRSQQRVRRTSVSCRANRCLSMNLFRPVLVTAISKCRGGFLDHRYTMGRWNSMLLPYVL
jgi:hypothetical protein